MCSSCTQVAQLYMGIVFPCATYCIDALLYREALPDANVADVQMAYDVSKLTKLSKKLWGH